MDILVLGAGMIGQTIAYDLCKYSNFDKITVADKDGKALVSAEKFLKNQNVIFDVLDINKKDSVKNERERFY